MDGVVIPIACGRRGVATAPEADELLGEIPRAVLGASERLALVRCPEALPAVGLEAGDWLAYDRDSGAVYRLFAPLTEAEAVALARLFPAER